MKTAQDVTPVTPTAQTTEIASPPPVQPLDTAGQLMADSNTPEGKKAAFMALFYSGTDETLTKAVDYFYENPVLFSKTVKDLAGSCTHKDALKSFIQKISDPELRIRPAMETSLKEALSKTTWSEYHSALKPFFALKDTFEGIDKNRRSTRSCPSACDLLRTFNTVNDQITRTYVHLMYKKVGTLDMDK